MKHTLVQSASENDKLSVLPETKPAKINPVKRTRFRSKDKKKIVLKRRKVKRLRTRPKGAKSEEFSREKDGFASGLAPEAHRGGSLAELALATLSQEEASAEIRTPLSQNRDILIMKARTNFLS